MAESRNPLADQVIADTYLALQQGNIKEASRLAQQARQLAPEKEETWLLLAYLSEPEQGLHYAQEALKIHPASKRARQAIHYLLKKKQQSKSVSSDKSVSSQFMEFNNQLSGIEHSLEENIPKENGNRMNLETIEKDTANPIKEEIKTDLTEVLEPKVEQNPVQSETEQNQNKVKEERQNLEKTQAVNEINKIQEYPEPESVTQLFETKKTGGDSQSYNPNDSIEEIEVPESLNQPSSKIVPVQPKEVKDELISESEMKGDDHTIRQEPQSERPAFSFRSESPEWEIDPVIVSLILLGILVSTVTIYAVLIYHHILP